MSPKGAISSPLSRRFCTSRLRPIATPMWFIAAITAKSERSKPMPDESGKFTAKCCAQLCHSSVPESLLHACLSCRAYSTASYSGCPARRNDGHNPGCKRAKLPHPLKMVRELRRRRIVKIDSQSIPARCRLTLSLPVSIVREIDG